MAVSILLKRAEQNIPVAVIATNNKTMGSFIDHGISQDIMLLFVCLVITGINKKANAAATISKNTRIITTKGM